MSTTQIIIIVAILTILAYFLIGRKKKVTPKSNKRLEDLSPTDRIEITGFGKGKERLTVEIKNKNRHAKNDGELYWYEYEGITNRNEDFWLQLESINPYELNGGTTKISVYELGTTLENLMSIDSDEIAFRYGGEDFYFDTDGEATCYTNEGSKGYAYSYREFCNEKDDTYISIEIVENEEPKVYLSFDIEAEQIQIIS